MVITKKQAQQQFNNVRTKMLTNWKVLQDGIINENSTPVEIIQYVSQLQEEFWMQLELHEAADLWFNDLNTTKNNDLKIIEKHCNDFFSLD